jgi:hypothetical protein
VALAILSPAFQGLKQRAPPTAKTVSATMLACHSRKLCGTGFRLCGFSTNPE